MEKAQYAYLPSAAHSSRYRIYKRPMRFKGRGKKIPWFEIVALVLIVGVIVGIVVSAVVKRKKTREIETTKLDTPPFSNEKLSTPYTIPSPQTGNTIFISIPSYRDIETASTLFSIFYNAKNPYRVFVGVCQQNTDEDLDCLEGYNEVCTQHGLDRRFMDSIRIQRVQAAEAKGPCLARQNIENTLYKNEEFFLQIDSHTRFCNGWDDILIEEWSKFKDPKAILTTYPPCYERGQPLNEPLPLGKPTFLFPSSFDENAGLPIFASRECRNKVNGTFTQVGFSGNFAFSKASRLNVPYLSKVPYLFFGEEYTMGGLLWTHGFTFYIPSVLPIYTLFDREYRRTFWEIQDENRDFVKKQSLLRVHSIINGKEKDHPHGTQRTMRDWEAYLGASLMDKTIDALAMAGISPEASLAEIICKVGSMSKLQEFVSSMNKR